MKITGYKDIPLENLEIGRFQARTREVSKNIEDLATSIAKLGLLEPIVVAPLPNDKYEIVTGQRRFIACQHLGLSTIKAGILDSRPEGDIAKAISLTENMVREDMPAKDYIDACTELYKRYGTIKAVSEELGLPHNKVSQYVKFEQLVQPLKEAVSSGDIDMQTALRAQKAATNSKGDVNPEAAVTLAEEMKGLAGPQQRALTKASELQPSASVEELIESSRKQQQLKRLTITIGEDLDSALNKFAHEEGTNREDAASILIETGLTERGYTGAS